MNRYDLIIVGQFAGTYEQSGIAIFAIMITFLIIPFSNELAGFLNAPEKAFFKTSSYVKKEFVLR